MKKLLRIFILIAATSSLFISCEDEWDEKNIYVEDSLLHFDYSGRDRTFTSVSATEVPRSLPLSFNLGLTKPANVEASGTLVYLADESTAVLGTDFIIDKGTAVIPAGSVVDDFQLTIFSNSTGFEANGNQSNVRTAVFEYTNNSSVPNAGFNQKFTVNITTKESAN